MKNKILLTLFVSLSLIVLMGFVSAQSVADTTTPPFSTCDLGLKSTIQNQNLIDSCNQQITSINKVYPDLSINGGFLDLSNLETLQLTSHDFICSSDCESTIAINLANDNSPLIDAINFYNYNSGNDGKQINIPYTIYYESEDDRQIVNVPDYSNVCIDTGIKDLNGSYEQTCDIEQTGSHEEYQDNWNTYNLGDNVPAGNYFVMIEGTKNPKDSIDWVIKSQGVNLKDWSVWGSSTYPVNPTLKYLMNEGSGTSLNDSSGFGATNSTLVGSPTYNNSLYVSSPYGLNILSNGQYASLINPDGLSGSNNSVSIWFYPTSLPVGKNASLVSKDSGGIIFYLFYNNTGYLSDIMSTSNLALGNQSVVLNSWNNAVVVWNSTRQYLYLNGNLTGTGTSGGGVGNGGNTWIGAKTTDNTIRVNGVLDDFLIWNRTLTSTEVSQIWNIFNTSSVTLNSPIDNYNTIKPNNNFNCSANVVGGTLVNMSLFTNESGSFKIDSTQLLTGATNSTIFNDVLPVGSFSWTCQACDNSGNCGFGSNRTINVLAYSTNNVTYVTPVQSLSTNPFMLNITISPLFTSGSAILVYNSTNYYATATSVNGNSIFSANTIAPLVSNSVNISFYWNIQLVNSSGTYLYNTSSYNQNVSGISLDDCSTYHNVIINFTNFDEDLLTPLNPSTYNVQVRIGTPDLSQAVSYSTNRTALAEAICLSSPLTSTYRMDLTTQWYSNASFSGNYFVQYYNLQNFTLNNLTMSNNVSLYDLNVSNGLPFQIQVRNGNYLPLTNAIIEVDRQYVQNGNYRLTESPLTDSTGSTIGHFVISNNVLYNIYIKQNGQLLYAFLNQQPYCNNYLQLCTMNFNIPPNSINPTSPTGYGVSITSYSYNDTTQTYTISFNSNNGNSIPVTINGTINDNYLNISVCSQSITANTGTLNCVIPLSYQNQSIIIQASTNGNVMFTDYITTGSNYLNSVFSKSRYLLAGFLLPAIVLMAGGTASIGAVAFIFGLLVCVMLFMVNGTIMGASSFILYFVISAIIFIIKSQSGGVKNG